MSSKKPRNFKSVVYNFWGPHWDSTLRKVTSQNDGNMGLKLRIKVHFRPIELRNGPQGGVYPEHDDRWNAWHWDYLAFRAWRNEVKLIIEQFWENKFWLVPPEDYDGLDVDGLRPNLACELKLELLETPGGAHHVFNVMVQGEHRANRVLAGGNGFTGWLADTDRGATPDSNTKIIQIKDLAHLFSMPLIGRDNTGIHRYYRLQMPLLSSVAVFNEEHAAHVPVEDRGVLHKVQIPHALPWMKAACEHTGVDAERWKVATKRPAVTSVSQRKGNNK
ncbi:MAG: hypothetical protein NZV14_14900 [Bryobacteraceae bacterium]|nr:hypothetical protein [Bryobacteraceae bacterium]MDW8379452.1 hypothetical protein [Bryobacterales bacterium]